MAKEKTIFETINGASRERAAALEDLRAKLEKEKDNKAAADAKAKEAINNGNADKYTKAKADSRTAADKIEFFNIQLKNTETAPLFDNPAERKAMAEEVREHVETVKADKMKAAAEMLKEARDLIEDVRTEITNGNEALRTLATNTNTTGNNIDIILVNGLAQRIRTALDHADIIKYV